MEIKCSPLFDVSEDVSPALLWLKWNEDPLKYWDEINLQGYWIDSIWDIWRERDRESEGERDRVYELKLYDKSYESLGMGHVNRVFRILPAKDCNTDLRLSWTEELYMKSP